MGNPVSQAKDQVVAAAESKAKQEVTAVKGRVTAALANHPKTFVVIALIVGFVLGAIVSAQFVAPKAAAGATAPHSAYNAQGRASWQEFVPFDQGGAQGNG